MMEDREVTVEIRTEKFASAAACCIITGNWVDCERLVGAIYVSNRILLRFAASGMTPTKRNWNSTWKTLSRPLACGSSENCSRITSMNSNLQTLEFSCGKAGRFSPFTSLRRNHFALWSYAEASVIALIVRQCVRSVFHWYYRGLLIF